MAILHIKTGLPSEMFRMYDGVVDTAADVDDGVYLAKDFQFAVVVCPRSSVRALRSAGVTCPVLALASTSTVGGAVEALSVGADDCQPFSISPEELAARIRALARRMEWGLDDIVKFGNVEIDDTYGVIRVNGVKVRLSLMLRRFLKKLLRAAGRKVTHEAMTMELYGSERAPFKVFDVYVCKIRRLLRDHGSNVALVTHWGEGWSVREGATAVAAE